MSLADLCKSKLKNKLSENTKSTIIKSNEKSDLP